MGFPIVASSSEIFLHLLNPFFEQRVFSRLSFKILYQVLELLFCNTKQKTVKDLEHVYFNSNMSIEIQINKKYLSKKLKTFIYI